MRNLLAIIVAFALLTVASSAGAEETADEACTDSRIVFGAIAIGVGGAAIVAGSVIGIVAAAQYADLDCPGDVCSDELREDAEAYNDLRIPSGITIAAGALTAFIGVMFVVYAANDDKTYVALRGSGNGLALDGRF